MPNKRPSRLLIFEKFSLPPDLIRTPPFVNFRQLDLSNCKISKRILSTKIIWIIILCQEYIVVENEELAQV